MTFILETMSVKKDHTILLLVVGSSICLFSLRATAFVGAFDIRDALMTEEALTEVSAAGGNALQPENFELKWMLPPNLAPGVSLIFTQVIKSASLTPEALDLLSKLMVEQQKIPPSSNSGDSCDHLQHCTSYHGGHCPRLTSCGTFDLPKTLEA